MRIKDLFLDFIHLIYPNNCLLCGESLVKTESQLCLFCLFSLPKTNYHLQKDNPIEKRFWGKVNIEHASSFFYFQKGSSVQKLLHELKYHGNKEIGELLGAHLGMELLQSPFYKDIDLIVPVPLHKNRYQKRGYNQSECIAKGISSVLKKPVDTQTLIRVVETSTQTKKGVFERWENTNGIFALVDNHAFKSKHILLVDDVLTTGSTLEACAKTLIEGENSVRVSIVTLAVA
jgi:ComF family protein